MNIEQLNILVENQLEEWPLAAENFRKLKDVRRKQLAGYPLDLFVQFNPARAISTGASVDKKSIASRPCFLCENNLPVEQYRVKFMENRLLLLNPYPILPMHFTIADTRHIPQDSIPLDMASMAEQLPGFTIFFNGARAGASAPDHLHVQAVLTEELPLMRWLEARHTKEKGLKVDAPALGDKFPFDFISMIIPPDRTGMKLLSKAVNAFGIDADTGKKDKGLVNAFFWIAGDGILRAVVVPRKRHRPKCYSASDEEGFMISPGCIDMAGLLIAPRKNDFERLDENKMREIYADVAFAGGLPSEIKTFFEL